ncbi:hypothetical protein FSP39_011200 [Pinctada imbricata]|uniref:Protein LLP homolog n=1 Tax=Pinctada imbricata TaxID=66713 RepID=A0AA88YQS6_PINIB|nr:hypothetical protein FSP39_011200 [Pinctada imbricata]
MAKSIKSKWRRKMRNIKREKYAKKDLEKLKQMVDAAKEGDEEMKELFTEGMDIDGKGRNPKTLRDENGHYPVWMNSRRVRKHKNSLKKKSKKKGKK